MVDVQVRHSPYKTVWQCIAITAKRDGINAFFRSYQTTVRLCSLRHVWRAVFVQSCSPSLAALSVPVAASRKFRLLQQNRRPVLVRRAMVKRKDNLGPQIQVQCLTPQKYTCIGIRNQGRQPLSARCYCVSSSS